MTDAEYVEYELGRVKGDGIKVKFESDDGDSRWLSITREQFEAMGGTLILSTETG